MIHTNFTGPFQFKIPTAGLDAYIFNIGGWRLWEIEVHNTAESSSADHFTMMLRGWPSANNEVGVQMVTLNEPKTSHYCITKGNCAGPGWSVAAGIAGSNPAGVMDVCVLWMLFVVRLRSLLRGDQKQLDVPRSIAQAVMFLTCLR